VRFDNPAQNVHLHATSGLQAGFGVNSVRISGTGITVVVVKNGSTERISIRSSRATTSGKVVRGGFTIPP
jgi:hypothetical protein